MIVTNYKVKWSFFAELNYRLEAESIITKNQFDNNNNNKEQTRWPWWENVRPSIQYAVGYMKVFSDAQKMVHIWWWMGGGGSSWVIESKRMNQKFFHCRPLLGVSCQTFLRKRERGEGGTFLYITSQNTFLSPKHEIWQNRRTIPLLHRRQKSFRHQGTKSESWGQWLPEVSVSSSCARRGCGHRSSDREYSRGTTHHSVYPPTHEGEMKGMRERNISGVLTVTIK